MTKIKASEEHEITLPMKIHAGILANIPLIIWGTPGGGKTSSVYDVARTLEMDCYSIQANTYEPTYFGGFPRVVEDDVVMSKPEFIKDLEKFNKPVIVFLDELPTTPRATQNVLLRIIQERKIGNWELNKYVRIVAAGNFVEVAGNTLLSPALANRFLHLFHIPKVEEWLASLSGNIRVNFNHSDEWTNDVKYYENLVVDFAETYGKANPEFFSSLPTEFNAVEDYAYATPRTLTMVAKALALTYMTDLELCKELCRGLIGKTAAVKMMSHIASKNKLDKFTEINLKNYKFSKDSSQVTVLLRTAAMYADEKRYCDKAIDLFKLAYDSGFQSNVMKYGSTLAKNLQKSDHTDYAKFGGPKNAQNIIKKLPFITEIIAAEMRV